MKKNKYKLLAGVIILVTLSMIVTFAICKHHHISTGDKTTLNNSNTTISTQLETEEKEKEVSTTKEVTSTSTSNSTTSTTFKTSTTNSTTKTTTTVSTTTTKPISTTAPTTSRVETTKETTTTTIKPTIKTTLTFKNTSSSIYSANYLKQNGRITWGGYDWTWYTDRILPGYGLNIPGRHYDENGFICDKDGYICLANDALPRYTVIDTPFGKQGKVYDRGCGYRTIDVYTNF